MRDTCAIIGSTSLSVGAGLAYLPLGFIVGGGLLLSLALWGHVRTGGVKRGPA